MRRILKRLFAGKELRALERYRAACHLAYRWNGNKPNSAETAEWIMHVGEGLVTVGKHAGAEADVAVDTNANVVDDLNELLVSVDAEI